MDTKIQSFFLDGGSTHLHFPGGEDASWSHPSLHSNMVFVHRIDHPLESRVAKPLFRHLTISQLIWFRTCSAYSDSVNGLWHQQCNRPWTPFCWPKNIIYNRLTSLPNCPNSISRPCWRSRPYVTACEYLDIFVRATYQKEIRTAAPWKATRHTHCCTNMCVV